MAYGGVVIAGRVGLERVLSHRGVVIADRVGRQGFFSYGGVVTAGRVGREAKETHGGVLAAGRVGKEAVKAQRGVFVAGRVRGKGVSADGRVAATGHHEVSCTQTEKGVADTEVVQEPGAILQHVARRRGGGIEVEIRPVDRLGAGEGVVPEPSEASNGWYHLARKKT